MSREESDKIIAEARLLLPWYLTNTLSDEEQDLVNRALEASPELRKEFVREEKMMRLVKKNTSLLELSALDTTEQRLEATLARIDREQQQTKFTRAADSQTKPRQVSKDGWFKRLFAGGLFGVEWLNPANAVFASLMALQVGFIGYYQLGMGSGDTVYETVTAEQSSAVGSAGKDSSKNLFLMEFQATAQYGEVCDFLNNWDAQIVSGPNGGNMFTVEMKTSPDTDVVKFADSIMSQASQSNAPVIFVGPQYTN